MTDDEWMDEHTAVCRSRGCTRPRPQTTLRDELESLLALTWQNGGPTVDEILNVVDGRLR